MGSYKQNTQDKIIEAAANLFLQKGFERTSVREIASKARINLSLMNYYFRSKEILFETIINLLIGKNSSALNQILDSNLPLAEKIRQYVSKYIDILIENPLLISFVLAVLHRNPEKITHLEVTSNLYTTEIFTNQLKFECMKGNIRNIDPLQFYISMLSLIAFPFAIKHLVNEKNKFQENEFIQFIKDRKPIICDMLLLYLKK